MVAPFVGVWIEIPMLPSVLSGYTVAPFVGVWIEIELLQDCYPWMQVAPFVGVWIEIIFRLFSSALMLCRSLRGSVD